MNAQRASEGRSLGQMLQDRRRKQGWYDTADYWDMKAESYEGLARSNWPSNRYNRHVHARQMATLDRLLGDVSGLRIADIGCGTGRTAAHLGRRGARVTGFDFSPKSVAAAALEHADVPGLTFRVGDVSEPPAPDDRAAFDVVMTLGCLTLACKDEAAFRRAVAHVRDRAVSGGRVVFLEPIHASRLLRRILRLSVDDWIRHCEDLGLRLEARGGVCFVPSRILLAYRDVIPDALVAPIYDGGEALLDAHPAFERLADYKYLVFRNP
ncbi:MAG: class I SAM-dependent methyltransferase [Myxococcota bacterium]